MNEAEKNSPATQLWCNFPPKSGVAVCQSVSLSLNRHMPQSTLKWITPHPGFIS